MTAETIPFPAARRVGLIRKMARLLATYSPDAAERTLRARLDAAKAVMLRRGISPEVAAREVRSLELAIRSRLWSIVRGGDAA
jgi:DNA-binding transcriptional regulator YdaS (Cro superfamily)